MKKETKQNPYQTFKAEPIKASNSEKKPSPVSHKISTGGDLRSKAGR